MSIFDIVNTGNTKTPSLAEVNDIHSQKIFNKDLNGIINDESNFSFFAQTEKLPDNGIKVNLSNENGLGYVGTIYIGSQPAKVLFDTGSDYLAVTSSLCNDE